MAKVYLLKTSEPSHIQKEAMKLQALCDRCPADKLPFDRVNKEWYRYAGELDIEEDKLEVTLMRLWQKERVRGVSILPKGESIQGGDIIEINGRYYLCAVFGFKKVQFR